MKPNFEQMTTNELKSYVLTHRDDGEAIRALFSRRSPDETATWYSSTDSGQMEEVLQEKIQEVEKGQV